MLAAVPMDPVTTPVVRVGRLSLISFRMENIFGVLVSDAKKCRLIGGNSRSGGMCMRKR
jgi:hypothetical protein